MKDFLVILGRQPALGLAELESLYGTAQVRPVGHDAAFVQAETVNFDALGSAMKICKILATLDTMDWREIERYMIKSSVEHAHDVPEGKLQIGISAYGFLVTPQQILATGLSIKKAIKKSGRSVRLTPNKEAALNTAQVLHNHLTGPMGGELVLARDDGKTILAQTLAAQDIDSYTLRDRGRPKRDTRVGMLPPKLAQIIINLAGGAADPNAKTLLDPFCGTGVVLQEALLMGYQAYGTDLEPRLVEYSRTNLEWFSKQFNNTGTYDLETGDATSHKWQPPIDIVASETYLGRPFTTSPSREMLTQTVSECNLIIKKFLKNIHTQLQPGTRLCLAIPAWKNASGFTHLPLLDQISDLGYNRMSFEHASNENLVYYRENQIVARELLVIIRN